MQRIAAIQPPKVIAVRSTIGWLPLAGFPVWGWMRIVKFDARVETGTYLPSPVATGSLAALHS